MRTLSTMRRSDLMVSSITHRFASDCLTSVFRQQSVGCHLHLEVLRRRLGSALPLEHLEQVGGYPQCGDGR
jgi:hypothetical protein